MTEPPTARAALDAGERFIRAHASSPAEAEAAIVLMLETLIRQLSSERPRRGESDADRYLRLHVRKERRPFIRAGGIFLASLRMRNVLRVRIERLDAEAQALLSELIDLRGLEREWIEELIAAAKVFGRERETESARRARKTIRMGNTEVDFLQGEDE